MAEAAIREELQKLNGEVQTLRDRDDQVAAKVTAIEAEVTKRLAALEAAFVAERARGAAGPRGLRYKEAEKYMPEPWSGEKGAPPFSDFAYDIQNYLSVLEPEPCEYNILEWAASQDKPITRNDVEDLDLDENYPYAKAINAALGQVLTRVTKDTAKTVVKQAGPGNGLRARQNLARWYRPRSAMDKATSITMVMNPGQCKDMGELHRRLEEWEIAVREHEARFDDRVQESVRIAALMSMIPKAVYDLRFKGRSYPTYLDLRQELANYLADRRPTIQVKAPGGTEPTAMDIGELGEAQMRIEQEIEALNAVVKGKGKGKGSWAVGKKGGDANPDGQNAQWDKPGKAGGKKGGGKGKAAGKGKSSNLVCYNCGGKGHPARLCPSAPGVYEMDENEEHPASEGSRGAGDTEEDHEPELQMCGLEEFNLLTYSGEETMAAMANGLEEKQGWTKTTAVVDSGSAENAIPERALEFVPTTPSPGSRAGKVYRGAGGEPIPNKGQKVVVVKTAEGQKRRTTWQVCPVTRPLMSVAKMAKAGNSVHLAENNPHIKNTKTGEVTKLRKEGNVFVVDLWVKVPPPPSLKQGGASMEVDEGFHRPGRARR